MNAQIESTGKILGGSRETLKQKVVLKVPEILNNGLKLELVRSPSEHAAPRQASGLLTCSSPPDTQMSFGKGVLIYCPQ